MICAATRFGKSRFEKKVRKKVKIAQNYSRQDRTFEIVHSPERRQRCRIIRPPP
jgi:hypothetical protein